MSDTQGAYQRFIASMKMSHREWRDDTGYDLVALRAGSADERRQIESLLIERGVKDWRDLEALAALNSDGAKAEIRATLSSATPELRLWAAQYLKDTPGCEDELERAVLHVLDPDRPFHVLMLGFTAAAELPTQKVKDALFHLALHGEGAAASRAAGLLLFLHGLSVAHYPAGEREFLNSFATSNRGERVKAFQKLCERVGAPVAKYR